MRRRGRTEGGDENDGKAQRTRVVWYADLV